MDTKKQRKRKQYHDELESRHSRVQHTEVEILVRQSDAHRHFGHNFELYEHRWATHIRICRLQRLTDCRLGLLTCFLDSDTHDMPTGKLCMQQMKVSPKHATRFNSGIWGGRCTISNAHLVVDGKKWFRTRTVRRFPEGSERWNHETMQRFAVNVTNPIRFPTFRRDVPKHDEMDGRLDEREHDDPHHALNRRN